MKERKEEEEVYLCVLIIAEQEEQKSITKFLPWRGSKPVALN